MGNYDVKKTAVNVREFFKHDFWHYMNEGGMHPDQIDSPLSSPIISDMPVNHSNINTAEKSIINAMSKAELDTYLAKIVLGALYDVTNRKNEMHEKILELTYVRNFSFYAVRIKLNFSEYQLKKEKRKALCEFALRFNHWREYFKVEDVLPNLLCPLNNKNQLFSPKNQPFSTKIRQKTN